MKYFIHKKEGGYTLIEAMVYIGVLTILLGVIFGSVIAVLRTYRKVRASGFVEESAFYALSRMSEDIRSASTVNLSSTLDSHPGRLILDGVDANGVPITNEIYLSENVLRLKTDGVDQGPLTSDTVRVTNLIFRTFSNSIKTGVKIEMTIESGTGENEKSVDFFNSVVLRNS